MHHFPAFKMNLSPNKPKYAWSSILGTPNFDLQKYDCTNQSIHRVFFTYYRNFLKCFCTNKIFYSSDEKKKIKSISIDLYPSAYRNKIKMISETVYSKQNFEQAKPRPFTNDSITIMTYKSNI